MAVEEDEGSTDPARAFDDLRAEVAVMRRAVEALPRAWAENQPPDYSPDLGRISKVLTAVASQLDAINKHPSFRMTPEQHSHAIAQASSGLVRETTDQLDRAAQSMSSYGRMLSGLIGTLRTQREQNTALIYIGIITFVFGFGISPFLYGLFPFGLNEHVAAVVMRADRWEAGEALMQADNPNSWNAMVSGWDLVRANQKEIAECTGAAAKTKKDQRCMITVKVP